MSAKHPLHDYLATQVAEQLSRRRVVVWYDPRSEFGPFINELCGQPVGSPLPSESVTTTQIGDHAASLSCYHGSFFAIRAAVEPIVAADNPAPLLIYLAGVSRDQSRSPLLELELGGTTYEPQLKRQARNVLRRSYTDGVIDEMLASDHLAYRDIAALTENAGSDGGPASILRTIFPARDNAQLLAMWLADAESDADVADKAATSEIYKLISSRLGLELEPSVPLSEARNRLLRYLLVGEFRADLACPPPATLTMVPVPSSRDRQEFIREVTATLRGYDSDFYVAEADRIEKEFGLATAGIAASDLGAVDTFRFEERVLLAQCDALLLAGDIDAVLRIVEEGGRSFWVSRDVARQAQWETCHLIAALLRSCREVSNEMMRIGKRSADWVASYTREDGWFRIDQHARQLENWVAKLDDEPSLARSLVAARQSYDGVSQRMAEGFSKALSESDWQIPGIQAQTKIYDDTVKMHHGRGSGAVAIVLVDALRFEMGRELANQIQTLGELSFAAVACVIPSITKLGMAALLPGAATSYNVIEERSRLAATIEGTPLPDLTARQGFLTARVPRAEDVELADLFDLPKRKKLAARLKDATVIVVRSQDIDSLGEGGHAHLARQVMDTMIANVARAVRRLAALGIDRVVITADHGHLFAAERGDDMKIESPGGQQVELHRRCWIGRGGSTPPGTVRVSGAHLGYASDLDFVFPTGLGVFKAGGDLAYHHGGISLQELIVPVLQLRIPRHEAERTTTPRVIIADQPKELTNRTLGVTLTLLGDLFTEPTSVRPILLSGSEQVGFTGMALNGEFDRGTGCVTLQPGVPVSIGMMLTREDCVSIRIVVQNPVNDALLGQTDEIPVRLGM